MEKKEMMKNKVKLEFNEIEGDNLGQIKKYSNKRKNGIQDHYEERRT